MSVYNKANQGQHLRFPLNNSVNYGKETGCPMDLFWGNGSEPFDFYYWILKAIVHPLNLSVVWVV